MTRRNVFKLIAVGAMCVTCNLCLSSTGLAEDPKILLQALRDMRRDALSDIRSGRGTATFTRTELRARRAEVSVPQRKVDFIYHGNDNLVRFYRLDHPELVLESALRSGQVDSTYTAKEEHAGPAGVLVRQVIRPGASGEIPDWSVYSLATMPALPPGVGEQEYFGALIADYEKIQGLSVRKDGTNVVLALVPSIPKELQHLLTYQKDEYAFDLLHRGMMTAYTHIQRSIREQGENGPSHKVEIYAQQKLEWGDRDGVPILLSRKAESICRRDGVVTDRIHTEVSFTSLHVGKVEDKELSFDAMGIPEGTPVMDSVRGIDWRYMPGVAATSPTSAPDGRR